MPPLILLAIIAGLPFALTIVLRIKPLYFFIAVVTGYFWATFLGDTAELTLRSLVHIGHPGEVIRIFLLLIPSVLTLMLLRRSLAAGGVPIQMIMLAADSLLLASFLLPLLTISMQQSIYQTHVGSVFHQAHDVLIAGVAGIHALLMWLLRPRAHEAHRGHHKKR